MNDPDYIYNFAMKILQGTEYSPEDFGYKHPLTERYKDYSRGELINELHKLKEELKQCYRYLS